MKFRHVLVMAAAASFGAVATQAQVLNRLKNKVENKGEQKASEAIDNLFDGKKKDQNSSNGNSQDGQGTQGSQTGSTGTGGTTYGSGGPSNKGGGGLVSAPPDVKQNLADAEAAYKKSSYGEARYAVQQAMLGVELEIGNKILKSLPESIAALPKVTEDDQVTSTGHGWAGLTIVRRYYDQKEKELTVTVANNSAWMAGVNAYMANPAYAQQTNGQQNWKQTKVKGYRAVIEYDDSSGYKLSVPLGQNSLIVYEAVNFATEPEVMKAAEAIDLDGIKKQLGEN